MNRNCQQIYIEKRRKSPCLIVVHHTHTLSKSQNAQNRMGGVFGSKNENQRTIGHVTLNDGDQLLLKKSWFAQCSTSSRAREGWLSRMKIPNYKSSSTRYVCKHTDKSLFNFCVVTLLKVWLINMLTIIYRIQLMETKNQLLFFFFRNVENSSYLVNFCFWFTWNVFVRTKPTR